MSLIYGGKRIIKCITSGKPKPTVKWLLNDTEIRNSEEFALSGSNLYILKVNDKLMHTTLKCQASNGMDRTAEDFMHIQIKSTLDVSNAELSVSPAVITSQLGETVRFACDFDSSKNSKANILNLNELKFKWFKSSGEFISSAKNGLLQIRKINQSDLGSYFCLLENFKTEETSRKFYVNLGIEDSDDKLIVSIVDDSQINVKDSNVTLTCEVNKPGDFSFSWSYNQVKISMTMYENFVVIDNKLIITNAQHEQTGIYSCHARTNDGLVQGDSHMLVTINE